VDGMNTVLAENGYYDFPVIAPRWELVANDAYGSSPAMDALGDVIQLQHMTKKKAQGIDKLISPPVLADIQLQHKPTALLPNGVTFVHGVNNVGVKPIYTVNPPLGDMTMDIRDIQQRIREIFHNPLFNMISQLDTVRSATEIDARREEKLILLGPVLERFENEALDPAIKRIFGIMQRKGLIPEPPEDLADKGIEIQYVSILSAAQSAVGTISTERWLALIGNLVGIWPEAAEVPDITEVLRDYGRDVGVPAKLIRSKEEIATAKAALAEQAEANRGMEMVTAGADAAKTLASTPVGGGASALQQIMGGVGGA
jgi:hypothetical protein